MSKDIDALSQYMDAVEELVFGVRAELRELKEANQARVDADKAWDVGAAVAGVRTDFDAKIAKHTESLDEVRAALDAALEEVKSLPAPEKGDPGKDGKDGTGIEAITVDNGSLHVRLTDGLARDLGSIIGPEGPPGKDGAAGKDGTDGRDGMDGKAVAVHSGSTEPQNPSVGDIWIVS